MKKLAVFLALILIISSGLIGCSGASKEASDATPASQDQGSQEPVKNITITMGGWYTKDSLDAAQARVTKYTEVNPNVTIEIQSSPDTATFYQNLQGQIASKTAPDVFQIEPNVFYNLVKSNEIAPVDDLMSQAEYNVSDIYDALINGYKVDGKLYAIPSDFNMLALYYNKDMLDAAGVKVPATYEELKSAAKELTQNGVYGLNINPIIGRIMPVVESFGGRIVDSNGQVHINDQDKVKGLKFLLDMYQNDKSTVTCKTLGDGWPGDTFTKKKAAMAIEGTWMLGLLKSSVKDFKWGVAPMPSENGNGSQLMYSGAYAVSANSENKQEAVKFLKWYLNPDNILQGFKEGSQSIPVQKSYKDKVISAFPELDAILKNTDSASLYSFGQPAKSFEDEMDKRLEELVYKPGAYDLQTVLDDIQNKFKN